MQPFQLGSQQRIEGRSLEDCPYPKETTEADEWRRGWLIANTSARMRSATGTFKKPDPRSA